MNSLRSHSEEPYYPKKKTDLCTSAGKESACNAGDPDSICGSRRSTGEEIGSPLLYSWAFLVARMVKNILAMWETWVWSLGWEDPLGEGNGYPLQYSCLDNFMDRGTGGLQFMGLQRVGHDWATFTFSYLEETSLILFSENNFLKTLFVHLSLSNPWLTIMCIW